MKLHESLFILSHTYDSLAYLQEIMLEQNLCHLDPVSCSNKDIFHFIALFKTSIIETCCFFEEYHDHFGVTTEKVFADRIHFVKLAAKPAINRINEWKDINLIRNELLAHGWRSKKGRQFTYTNLFNYKSPRNFMELVLLRNYMRLIMGLLEAEFEKELDEVPHYMNSIKPIAIPPSPKADAIEKLEATISNINKICIAANKHYRLDASKIIGNH